MALYEPPYKINPIFNVDDWRSERVSSSITSTTSSSTGTSLSNDAFGRSRVSEVGNRYDIEFTYDTQPLLTDQKITGNATITYRGVERDCKLSIVSTTANSSAVLSSGYNTPYTPGCSQIIEITGVMDLTGIGGGTMSIFHKNAGNTTIYTQNSWTNYSNAETCDWKYSQIFGIDFQSLKVGTARFFLVRDGNPVLVHQINNDNRRNSGYWQHPNLRPYWRIYNEANTTITEIAYGGVNNGFGYRYTLPTANSTASMSAICATVKSEGGKDLFDLPGYPFGTSNYLTSKTVADTLTPLLSIKVQPLYNGYLNRTIVIVDEVDVVTDNPILYRIILNPTLTNSNFVAIDANSVISKDVSSTAFSGGLVIDESYAYTGLTKSATVRQLLGRLLMSNNWDGTEGDILTIAGIRTTSQSASVLTKIAWHEIR